MTSLPRFRCAKNLRGRVHYVQAPESEHVGSGVLRKQQNEYVK